MKRIFSLLLMTVLCVSLFPVTVSAGPSGRCGRNVRWSINDRWEMTISGTGDMANWQYTADIPWYNYRGSLRKVTVQEGVTSIAPYAFYCQEALTEVVLADSVTKIGECAFMNTRFMTSLDLGEGVVEIGKDAFHTGRSLTEIVIPDSVTVIGERAFYDCDSVTEIVIPDSVTVIGESAFANCEKLTSVTVGAGVTELFDRAFSECPSLLTVDAKENAVCTAEDGVLFSKDKTTLLQYPSGRSGSYTVPDFVTKIAPWAFAYSALSEVTLPASVTEIGESAFYTAKTLASVTIGEGVTKIGAFAFYDCDGLTSVTVPAAVTDIGDSAFYKCNLLTDVEVLTSTASFGKNVLNPTGVTVTAYALSTAEAYAAANAIPFAAIEVPSEIPVLGIGIAAGAVFVLAAVLVGVLLAKKRSKQKTVNTVSGEEK